MATKFNKAAFDYARDLIDEGRVVHDERDAWSDDQPTAEQEIAFIRRHGFGEYAKWHLGTDPDAAEDTKKRYSFPTATSSASTGAACYPRRSAPASTNTTTSNAPPPTCTR